MTRVVVSGAAGRLGSRILARCLEAEGIEVVGAVVRSGSPLVGAPVEGSELRYEEAPELHRGDVLVESAVVPAALAHAAIAAEAGAAVCVATTGFEPAQRRALEAHASRVPVLIAPNLSLGVTVLRDLVQTAARVLEGYDIEVLEMHHRNKRDAPSGTAWALAEAASAARGRDIERDAVLARAGDTGARGRWEVGLQALRGGDVIGEHTVFMVGETERIELTHRAASRDAFAHGAVTAARFLSAEGRAAGLYSMRDVLGLASFAAAPR